MAAEKKQQYPNYIEETNDIAKELSRIKKLYGSSYSSLYSRSYEYVASFDYKSQDITTVNIMQFNMLADGLSGVHIAENVKDVISQKKTFIDVPKESLLFKYRGFRILEEITVYGADIICLQECDQFEFLLHYLSPLGFKGEFNPKSSSPCLKIAKANNILLNADGIAIFYNFKKFNIKRIDKFGSNIEKSKVDIPSMSIVFNDLKTNKDFIICCCHLKSTKSIQGEVIRLNQLQHLLPKMADISPNGIPLFVACDLNTNNNESYSTVYNSIMFPAKAYANDNKNHSLKPAMLKSYIDGYNGLNLWSAYYSNAIPNTEKQKNCEPIYTTWKKRSKGVSKHCIDYIFYQKDKAKLVRLLSIPSTKVINKKTLLPGFEYPSDHIALQACFQF